MKILQGILMLLVTATTVAAHPGWGIVRDSRGNVYFTDTKQVWRIAPDGSLSVAVPDVHTHELCVDPADNIFGEHLWYTAGARQPWRHRVWRFRPDGTVSDVIPSRAGFLTDYSFVRDRDGNMYWADRGPRTVIRKRSVNGRITTHALGDFRAVERMVATPDGTLFLMDAGRLRRVSPNGTVSTVVAALSSKRPTPSEVSSLNYHMGLWLDSQHQVYVAAAAEGLVLRVSDRGEVVVATRSVAPWAPSGGLIALAKDMREANTRGEKLGLTEDELAFYDALETNDSAVQVLGDETLRAIARELVETVRNNATIDWTLRENVRAQLRVLVKRILRKHGYPPDKQEKATQTVLEQAEVLSAQWAAA